MDERIRKRLKKQHYAIVGKHSGVKLCHWLKQSLIHKRTCYKQSFYGIQSHRCLQMTPTLNQCTQTCLFCWRFQGFTETSLSQADEPEFILDEAINAQRKLITGFKGDPRCKLEKWEEANNPNMLACSLSGEPTLYPRLGDFFAECHKRGITTFLVTNGTTPEVLKHLNPLPTQLYISLVAPNKDIYNKLCNPLIRNGWEKLQQTLEILPSLDTRTVIRQTLVNKWNLNDSFISDYARLIKKANPDFVEPKGYVFVGQSRKRMTLSNMPTFEQIKNFAKQLNSHIGYSLSNEQADSRVVLLTQGTKPDRIVKQH
jgi:tRNA wybutosine-synthesizing protein 1